MQVLCKRVTDKENGLGLVFMIL